MILTAFPFLRLLAALLMAGLAVASLWPTRAALAGEGEPYLAATDLDLLSILPPPPANGSAEDRAQQEEVLKAQHAAGSARIAQARADADESVFAMFGGVLGPGFDARSLPATDHLFSRIAASDDAVVTPAKIGFGHLHPWESNPMIRPLTLPTRGGSYPSGHTTRVTAFAIVLGHLLPREREALWARAHDYALSRVIGGMHYPNDLEGGRRAGTALAVALRSRPEFRADVEAARSELLEKYRHEAH